MMDVQKLNGSPKRQLTLDIREGELAVLLSMLGDAMAHSRDHSDDDEVAVYRRLQRTLLDSWDSGQPIS